MNRKIKINEFITFKVSPTYCPIVTEIMDDNFFYSSYIFHGE